MDKGFFYSANEYYKKLFGCKVYKIALNLGTTCPTRDGTKDRRGCIFCSNAGSGDFAFSDLKNSSFSKKSLCIILNFSESINSFICITYDSS